MTISRIRAVSFAAAALLILCAPRASRGADGAVRKAIEARYAQFSAAMRARKTERIMALTSPHILVSSRTGEKLNRVQLHLRFHQFFDRTTEVREFTVKIVKFHADRRKASAVVSIVMSVLGSDATGDSHQMQETETSEDVWEKSGKTWLLLTSAERASSAKVDGVTARETVTKLPAAKQKPAH